MLSFNTKQKTLINPLTGSNCSSIRPHKTDNLLVCKVDNSPIFYNALVELAIFLPLSAVTALLPHNKAFVSGVSIATLALTDVAYTMYTELEKEEIINLPTEYVETYNRLYVECYKNWHTSAFDETLEIFNRFNESCKSEYHINVAPPAPVAAYYNSIHNPQEYTTPSPQDDPNLSYITALAGIITAQTAPEEHIG